jgi:hypothetical protein
MADLVEKIAHLFVEYFQIISQLDSFQLDQTDSEYSTETIIMYSKTGISTILHILKISYSITKNVDAAFCNAQKGMYCYTQFIEKMINTKSNKYADIQTILNYVYEETIVCLNSEETTSIQNILSAVDGTDEGNEHVKKIRILNNLIFIMNLLVWIENRDISHAERTQIVIEYLPQYLHFFSDKTKKSFLFLLDYLVVLREKISITGSLWMDILELFNINVTKASKQQKIPTKESIIEKSMEISHAVAELSNSYDLDTAKCSIESVGAYLGWKTPSNDIVKWIF